MVEMSERDKFMLDLNGFLVVDDFLTSAEVDALNASFDANWERRDLGAGNAKRHAIDQFRGMLEWPTKDAQPFRDIIAHRKLVPILNTIFGRGWRMDQSPFMYTSTAGYTGEPGGGMSLHGGQTWGVHEGQNGGGMGAYYRYANGVMRTGMVVCAFQLGDGGWRRRLRLHPRVA